MKTKYFLCAIFALIAVSCSKEQQPVKETPVEEGPALVVSATTEQPGGTKTSLDGLNVKWTVGDKIYLTDGTNSAIYQATTNATSTSFSFVEQVSGTSFANNAVVYAYYPADKVTGFSGSAFTATIPAVQTYVAGGFADGINPMTAKATVADGALTLSFKNVMAFVKLQIADSANDGKVLTGLSLTSPSANLSGTATVTVANDGTATTAIETGAKSIELTGISATLSTVAASAYIAVPAYALGNITITATTSESTGSFTQTKTASNALTPDRSSINSYNPMQISSFTGKVAGSEQAANCYMIDASTRTSIVIPLSQAIAGWDAIKALEPEDTFDKTKITTGEKGTVRTIAVRWLDNATGTITLSDINASTMTLSWAKDGANKVSNGTNAVVDLKNDGKIVWSWHLWFTDYKPAADQDHTVNGQVHTYSGAAFQSGGLYEGKVMMDRNLGATKTGVSGAIAQPDSEDEAKKYFGLFYQFGRKDPFATTGTVTTYNVTSTKVTYANAAQNPNKFYYTTTSADAWSSTDATMTDPWNSNGTKSAFDPCPAGWRIPNNGATAKNNVWTGITTSYWNSGSNNTAGYLWCGAWLPAAGFRSANSGSLGYRGSDVYFWSSSPRVAGAGYFAYFNSGGVSTAGAGDGSRAYGLSVRCVKE